MSTDYRALCAELIAIFDAYSKDSSLLGIYDDLRVNGESVIDCARAALAADGPAVQSREPASVVGEPSDEEIIQEAIKADLVYRPINDEPYVFSGFVESHSLNTYVLSFARAVLARWGHQLAPPAQCHPEPVPVGERLPGPEDCDDQKRCWWLVLHQSWPCLYLMKVDSGLAAAVATHWLPAHALPLPVGEVE